MVFDLIDMDNVLNPLNQTLAYNIFYAVKNF